MQRTMAFRLVNDVVVLVHNSQPPSDRDYIRYMNFCRNLPATCNRYVIFTPGAGPNAAQRKLTTDTMEKRGDKNILAAVVTDSTMALGIVHALSWFSTGIRAYSSSQVDDAWRYLKVTDTEAAQIMAEMRELRAEVGD
jgi:hypothetical protein